MGEAQAINLKSLEEALAKVYVDETQTPTWLLESFKVPFVRNVLKVKELPVLKVKTHENLEMNQVLEVKRFQPDTSIQGGYSVIRNDKPLFELQSNGTLYQDMEIEMKTFYTYIGDYCRFPVDKMEVGMHAVFNYQEGQDNQFKRVKITEPVEYTEDCDISMVTVLLIDEGCDLTVDTRDLLLLYKQFASLPPRDLGLILDGMKFYEQYQAYRRATYMETGLWDGVLKAVVVDVTSNEVIIYSSFAPEECYPYGVNELIIRRVAEDAKFLKLPEIGKLRDGGFVVYATPQGGIFLQFDNPFDAHVVSLMKKLFTKIQKNKVKQRLPLERGTLVLIPYLHYVGTFYRGTVLSCDLLNLQVEVKCIDYGDVLNVSLADVVLANPIHLAFRAIPPLAIPAFLAGTESLDVKNFNSLVSPEVKMTVKVVSRWGKTGFESCEVELFRFGYLKKVGPVLDKLVKESDVLKWKRVEAPAVEVPPLTTLVQITHDILTFDGSGSECIFFRAGNKVVFNISKIDDRGKAYIYPSYVEERLQALEADLAESYKFWRNRSRSVLSCGPWTKGSFFMVNSSEYERVVRGCIYKDPELPMSFVHVWLVDYGYTEAIRWESFQNLHLAHLRLPSYGCRAWITTNDGKDVLSALRLREVMGKGKQIKGGVLCANIGEDMVPEAQIELIEVMA